MLDQDDHHQRGVDDRVDQREDIEALRFTGILDQHHRQRRNKGKKGVRGPHANGQGIDLRTALRRDAEVDDRAGKPVPQRGQDPGDCPGPTRKVVEDMLPAYDRGVKRPVGAGCTPAEGQDLHHDRLRCEMQQELRIGDIVEDLSGGQRIDRHEEHDGHEERIERVPELAEQELEFEPPRQAGQ